MLVALILLAVAVAAVPLSRRLTGDYFSPGAIVSAAWCGSLGLYALHLLPYPPMRVSTWLFLLAAAALILVGVLIGQRIVPGAGEGSARVPANPQLWVRVFSLLGVVGTVWYVWVVLTYMGSDAFSMLGQVRVALGRYEIPSRYLFLQFFCLAGPFLAFALTLGGVRLSPLTWTLVAVCTSCTWITTDRTQFFLLTLTAFFMYAFRHGSALNWSRMVTAVVVCGVLLAASFTIVGMWVGKTPKALGLVMRLPAPPPVTQSATVPPQPSSSPVPAAPTPSTGLRATAESLIQPGSTVYLYATGSFPALDVLLAAPVERTHGAHVAYPVARLLQRAGLISSDLPPAIPEFRSLGMTSGRDLAFNGYTMLYYPLMDFGPAGALIYAALIGVLSGVVYGWLRGNRQSPLRLLMMGHIATALVLSIFVNKFNNTATWYIAAMTALPFLTGRSRKSSNGSHAP